MRGWMHAWIARHSERQNIVSWCRTSAATTTKTHHDHKFYWLVRSYTNWMLFSSYVRCAWWTHFFVVWLTSPWVWCLNSMIVWSLIRELIRWTIVARSNKNGNQCNAFLRPPHPINMPIVHRAAYRQWVAATADVQRHPANVKYTSEHTRCNFDDDNDDDVVSVPTQPLIVVIRLFSPCRHTAKEEWNFCCPIKLNKKKKTTKKEAEEDEVDDTQHTRREREKKIGWREAAEYYMATLRWHIYKCHFIWFAFKWEHTVVVGHTGMAPDFIFFAFFFTSSFLSLFGFDLLLFWVCVCAIMAFFFRQ